MHIDMDSELKCANCGIIIRWQPTIVDAQVYCCAGCAQGGPCECDYDNLPPPGEIQAMILQQTRYLAPRGAES